MVILYVRMWRAAKRLRTKDHLATKWSLTIKEDNNNERGFMIDAKSRDSCSRSNESSPKRFHRPSAFLSAVRTPLVEIGILSIWGNKARLQMHSRSTEKGEDKARKTLGVIMSVFIICWLPFFILALLKSQKLVSTLPKWLDILTLWLGYFNR